MSRNRLSTIVLSFVVCADSITAGQQGGSQVGQPSRRLASASAESLIAEGLSRAQAEHKKVFVDFRASWCGPCLELQRFLQGPETKPIVDAHFVIVPITVWEQADNKRLNNDGGEKYLKVYGGGASIPFYAFLDEAGQKIAHGSGYPYGSAEIDALMDSMVKAAPGMSERDRAILFEQLAGSTSHRMWAAAAIDGAAMSPSGRYLAYTRMETPGVRVHDFVAGGDRPLAQVGDDPRAGPFVFSHDNRNLAYSSVRSDGTTELRIASVSNADPSPSRVLVSDRRFKRIDPYAWTADNSGLVTVTELGTSAGATVSIVSAADGSIHERRPFPEGVAMLALAPDGRTMALELGHRGGTGRIALMPMEAGEPGPTITGELIGWSSDGAFILFVRPVAGVRRLWTAGVQRGKVVKEREVDFTLGDSRSIGLTDAGVFYYLAPPHATRPPALWIVNDVFPRK